MADAQVVPVRDFAGSDRHHRTEYHQVS
jgi:hypothetical protein